MCYRLITLLLLCVLVFAGCRSEDPAPEPSPAALARSVQAEEDSALYLGLIRRLDFLLEGEDWQSPEEIDKVYLTQWYLRRWILSHGDGGEFLVTPLLSANEDGLFFPEGELEAAVEEAFGLSPSGCGRITSPTARRRRATVPPVLPAICAGMRSICSPLRRRTAC